MTKMKHLLRKLHIGGGFNDPQRLAQPTPQPVINESLNHTNDSSISSTPLPSPSSGQIGSFEAVEPPSDRTVEDVGGRCVDFDFLEEEFQLQMAMAISASDPDRREDPESAQIDAAKRMSLGCSNSDSDNHALVGLLSLQYWSYNAVNYDEKVMDGFYDIYGITSHSITQGKMPLLMDLQAISVSSEVDYEVILVNRLIDPELQELESRAYAVSMDCRVSENGLISGLIQKIADIVVDRMGGPVGDADDMLRRWNIRSYELRRSLNTIILPLGRLEVGLSRHRALLFKVLADRIDLPCMLVKGSYYTGTDDGAVNLIKIDNGSEYIIDLMGAPGMLIPSEVPSSQLPNFGSDVRRFADVTEALKYKCLSQGEGAQIIPFLSDLDGLSKVGNPIANEASFVGSRTKQEGRNFFKESQSGGGHEFRRLPELQYHPCESSSGTHGKPSSVQKKKVKNVSKYVISAAKNPEFAQKLHAVLLESGASPPPDLFSDMDPHELGGQKVLEKIHPFNGTISNASHPYNLLSSHEQSIGTGGHDSLYAAIYESKQKHPAEGLAKLQRELATSSSTPSEGFVLVCGGAGESIQVDTKGVVGIAALSPSGTVAGALYQEQIDESSLASKADSCQRKLEICLVSDDNKFFQDKTGRVLDDIKLSVEASEKSEETTNSERISPVLGEVAEWEIPWEDLHIGERIGIGSFGEVYRADWNGTEVAVKKFLDQDLSGDALVQLKCEVEIMLRMRHPNVVLFMGAVTRPPHFSILTEFLPRGSLFKLLHRPNSQLDEKRRLKMALDVVKGMNYLHTSHPTIVHRDLKSPNLLVDKNWVVKVCDFGLSRIKHHTFLSSKSTAGTPEWMAPEVLRNEPANEKCDVYSFGVILWELTTCRIPWKGLNPMQVVGAVGFQNRRLEIPEVVDPAVARIIGDCWQTEPHLRPSFSQLMSWLRRLPRLVIDRTNLQIKE